jgi:hypothetical protein
MGVEGKKVGGHMCTGCTAQPMDKAERDGFINGCINQQHKIKTYLHVWPPGYEAVDTGYRTSTMQWLRQQPRESFVEGIHWLECQWKPSTTPMGYIFYSFTQNNPQTGFI